MEPGGPGLGKEIRLAAWARASPARWRPDGQIINLRDAYEDPRFNREWDARNDYRTTSCSASPMRDTNGEVTGVIQALNAADGAFDAEDEELLLALGGQAAQAIENAMLHEEINRPLRGLRAGLGDGHRVARPDHRGPLGPRGAR